MRTRLPGLTLCAIVAVGALSYGCEYLLYPFDPCPEPDEANLELDPHYVSKPQVTDVGQMDWQWSLRTANGAVGPFVNPTNANEKILQIVLYIDTDVANRGSAKCEDVVRTSGTVTAVVDFLTGTSTRSTKRYTGTFVRDHKKNKTTISYGPYTLPLVKSGEDFTTQPANATGPIDGAKLPFVFAAGNVLSFHRQEGPNGYGFQGNRIPAGSVK